MMANPPELCCEGSVKSGLGWTETSDTVELRQNGSGTNSPEPSISVQAEGTRHEMGASKALPGLYKTPPHGSLIKNT